MDTDKDRKEESGAWQTAEVIADLAWYWVFWDFITSGLVAIFSGIAALIGATNS